MKGREKDEEREERWREEEKERKSECLGFITEFTLQREIVSLQ